MKNKFLYYYCISKDYRKKYVSVNLGILGWFKTKTRGKHATGILGSYASTVKGVRAGTVNRSKSQAYFRACSRVKNEE